MSKKHAPIASGCYIATPNSPEFKIAHGDGSGCFYFITAIVVDGESVSYFEDCDARGESADSLTKFAREEACPYFDASQSELTRRRNARKWLAAAAFTPAAN